ncbi:hypothetical protein CBR_g28069 [Chara braunii]|uniref:CAND6/7 N-terminal domain-containing protein n=1 Tax=Chara braunii TaxID=69332 RepID=A0A388L960_CHABU|nr:hypothetical protein CBR_g28069 [Chara braunii]|eukprot:GBG78845.1 hypothetical protein CBR_g28069 [Chara braunii]
MWECRAHSSSAGGHQWAVLLVAMLVLIGTCSAHKLHVDLELSKEPLTALTRFGFHKNGWVEVNLSHIDVYRSESFGPTDKSQIGILLAGRSAESQLKSFVKRMKSDGDAGLCILTETKVQKLLDMGDPGKAVKGSGGDKFTVLHEVEEPGYHTLYLANCACRHHAVSFTMDAALFNLEGKKGGKRNYLWAGGTHLALLYFVFFAVYFVACCAWQYLIWQKHQGVLLKRLLHLVGISLAAYMLLIWSHGTYYSVLGRTGLPHGWDKVHHFFAVTFAVSLLALVLLGLPDVELNVSDLELKLLMAFLSGLIISWAHAEVTHHSVYSFSLQSAECATVYDFFSILKWVSVVGLLGLIAAEFFPSLSRQRPTPSSLVAQFSAASADYDSRANRGWVQKWYVKISLYAAGVWMLAWLVRAIVGHHHHWAVVLVRELGVLGFFAAALIMLRPTSGENYHIRLQNLADGLEEEELDVRDNEEMEGF